MSFFVRAGRALLICVLLCEGAAAPVIRIGQNFTGSVFGTDSPAVPPDSDGAVGPAHFVEFLNGRFAVYEKSTGKVVVSKSDLDFWTDAGLNLPSTSDVTDPRVIFDGYSGRWFASQVDINTSVSRQRVNHFLLAVSRTADPSGAWAAISFPGNPFGNYFADFPTLGVDRAGVYLSGDLFDRFENPVGPVLAAIPKADLLVQTPATNSVKWSAILSYQTRGEILQPVITSGTPSSPEAVLAVGDLGEDFEPHSTLVLSAVTNLSPSLALGAPAIITVPEYNIPINPVQPDGSDTLDDGDARFSGSVKRVGDMIYAVHAIQENDRASIRWYRIDALSSALIESGTMRDPVLDFFYPSIAANEAGKVVIGFNASSSNTFVSSFAVAGEIVNGKLDFGAPVLLKTGLASYQFHDDTGTSRWGDYSATTVDPADPNRFWTIQEYPQSTTDWATQITEIILGGPSLDITRAGSVVTLAWDDAPGFQLQSAAALAPAAWTPVAGSPAVKNGQATLSVPLGGGSAFYRLGPR